VICGRGATHEPLDASWCFGDICRIRQL
jgi:hypothetical protein